VLHLQGRLLRTVDLAEAHCEELVEALEDVLDALVEVGVDLQLLPVHNLQLLRLLVLLRLRQDLLLLILGLEMDEANHLVDLSAHVPHG